MLYPIELRARDGDCNGVAGAFQFRVAPDVCVEVLSPANTRPEMAAKTAAYLAAGAREVWLVGEDGVREIHTSSDRMSVSRLGFELPFTPAPYCTVARNVQSL